MFYVLSKQHEKIYLEDGEGGNVLAMCPRCGKEHAVDLTAILSTGECDLYSTSSYCPACSAALLKDESPRRTAGEVEAYEEGRADAFDMVSERLNDLMMHLV